MALYWNKYQQLEVIDNFGNTIDCYNSRDNAIARCDQLGLSSNDIEWPQLEALRRKNGNIDTTEWDSYPAKD